MMGAKEPVIVIFVGLLPKMARGNCYDFSFFMVFQLLLRCIVILCF